MEINSSIDFFKNKARQIRLATVEMITRGKKGHIGGALSIIDVLCVLLYSSRFSFGAISEKKDVLLFSKGHAGVVLYPFLADLGFITQEDVISFGSNGSKLGNHPDHKLPLISMDTGSLGNGLGIGIGVALSKKLLGEKEHTFVVMGDGEIYEGSIWEAANLASHLKLGKLIGILDRNRYSATGNTEDYNALEPVNDKWRAFGWNVIEIDGHSYENIIDAFVKIVQAELDQKPTLLLCNTIKGKGVSFMENTEKWHHGIPNAEQLDIARKELKGNL